MFASRRYGGAAGPALQRSSTHSLSSSSSSSSSRLCRPAPQARPSVRAAAAAGPAELQSLLAQKERELASMFESGRPMPAAAQVAALRSEIATLDAQLNGRPAPPSMTPPGGYASGGGSGPPRFGGGPPPMQPPRSSAGAAGDAVRSRTEQLADKAYEMVEQQMRSNQGMGQEDDVEIARLEHENTQLRAEAYSLLARQQQLESMLAEVRGQKEPELLLESAEGLLARMRAKLQKA